MKYRLVCVIDINAPNKGVDVEICYETGTKNLSPFQRKVEVNDLIKSDVFSIDSLAGFVFLTGQTKQPFSFSTEQLQNQKLRDIINNNPWLYVKSGGKNSTLKRVASYSGFFSFSKKQDLEEGSLLFGELYISEIKYWWKNIKVRFRYKDSVDVFPVIYSDIPFLTENNMWFKRNRREEQNLLWPIESLIDNNESVLRLKENSFDLLKSLISSGWRLFVPKEISITRKFI